MKIAGEKETYMKIVDSIIVGPEIIRKIQILMLFTKRNYSFCRHVDLEDIFGINTDIFNLSYDKRKEQIEEGLRPSWKPDEHFYYRRLENRSPSPSRRFYQGSGGRRNKSWRCPDIHYQFELFAKFGDSGLSINFNLDLIN